MRSGGDSGDRRAGNASGAILVYEELPSCLLPQASIARSRLAVLRSGNTDCLERSNAEDSQNVEDAGRGEYAEPREPTRDSGGTE